MKKIILASGSPRRSEILKNAGIEFETMIPDIDEEIHISDAGIHKAVRALARIKAGWAFDRTTEPALIIAADTLVCYENKVLSKPRTRKEAYSMIKMLSGNWHKVITGYCVMNGSNDFVLGAETTKVHFRELDESEIEGYIDTKEPYDKAGAYGIQGRAGVFVDRIIGCYFNVMGLPVGRIFCILKKYEHHNGL